MVSPNTLARRDTLPNETVKVRVCLFCKQRASLRRLYPTSWMACQACMVKTALAAAKAMGLKEGG